MSKRKMEQEAEWSESQKTILSLDLISAAKKQLRFLAAIDRNRELYQSCVLDRAIYRYRTCWLPLLAQEAKSDVLEGPLVVPLDCEWVWHCHRLNPARYKADCEQCYGRILDNFNVVSTTEGTYCSKQTEEIWTRMFPNEPFELDPSNPYVKNDEVNKDYTQKSSDYDLLSAVKRQSTFFYQVSRPFFGNDLFLKEAVARYKGFLHLCKKNKEGSISYFCVPTYDIDLIWHAHQLHPESYCKDTTELCGNVLEHDDTDSDRTEGNKLDIGFMQTTKLWNEVYGLNYWKAGTLYRGNQPSPLELELELDARLFGEVLDNVVDDKERKGDRMVQLIPNKMMIEVLLEIVEIKGVPEEYKNNLRVIFSKQSRNLDHVISKQLSISSEYGKKQVFDFHCEPNGEMVFELVPNSSSPKTRELSKVVLGSMSISIEKLVNDEKELSIDSWFELSPSLKIANGKPMSLHVSLSFTPPFAASYFLHLVPSEGLFGSHISVLDEGQNQVIGLGVRQGKTGEKEVVAILESAETCIIAKNIEKGWSLMDSSWDLLSPNNPSKNGHLYELIGSRKVIIMPGMKSDYQAESKHGEDRQSFFTAVEFSPQHPHGKTVALFNLKLELLEIKEDWFLLPGAISACILLDSLMSNRATNFKLTEMCKREKHTACGNLSVLCVVRCGGACGIGGGAHYGGRWGGACGIGGSGGRCGGGGGGGRCGGSCGV